MAICELAHVTGEGLCLLLAYQASIYDGHSQVCDVSLFIFFLKTFMFLLNSGGM